MGVYAGPDVSESGLVLYLDAGNNKSHSTNRFISYGTGLTTQGISFQVNGDGTFQRIAAGTVIGGYTVRTTDVVYSYALGSNGCHYHGNTAPIPAGVYATFSFDYLVTGATTYPINNYLANFENYGGGALSGSIAAANNLQNVWQRRTFTSGPTGSAGTQAMFLYPGACGGRLADSGTIYFRNPKVEWTNVDTGDGNFSSMSNVTTWYDMSGNGNNGTLTNTPYYFISSNGTNGYMSFDGSDDYVNCGNNSTLNLSTFTSSSWVYPRNLSIRNNIVSKEQDANWVYAVGQVSNKITFWINNGSWIQQDSIANIALNTWVYITVSYDGNIKKIYINDLFDSQQNASGMVLNSSTPVIIGAQGQNFSASLLNGNIAQVSIYNRALTAAEIQQNFNSTRGRFGI